MQAPSQRDLETMPMSRIGLVSLLTNLYIAEGKEYSAARSLAELRVEQAFAQHRSEVIEFGE